ncbi:hypothetical protein ACGFMO_14435 [Streptomyces niveus]|jgi:hypothetical protein|uniref:hypothetical protein n=1 Tax=Streptomyces niveus TaxID=193462 RepID=UPI00371038C3
MRSKLAAAVGTMTLAAGTLMALPAATATAAPATVTAVTDYSVPVGQTYTKGTLNFTNRSVSVNGEQKSVGTGTGECRKTYATAYDGNGNPLDARSTTPVCGRSGPVDIPLTANVAGGAAYVEVCLLDERGFFLKCDNFFRP